jgi:hypothetical protein
MDPIVLAAGTAVVGAMATDAWRQARTTVVALWRRARPNERAEAVVAALESVRTRILAARSQGDGETEQALVGAWRLQLQQLLDEDPAMATELQHVLDECLTPALSPGEQNQVRSIIMKAEAHDESRGYQAGRDQHITER